MKIHNGPSVQGGSLSLKRGFLRGSSISCIRRNVRVDLHLLGHNKHLLTIINTIQHLQCDGKHSFLQAVSAAITSLILLLVSLREIIKSISRENIHH